MKNIIINTYLIIILKMDLNIHQRFEYNMTQLHKAVLNQDIQMIQLVLALNDKLLCIKDNVGFTPLHIAIKYELYESAELLLKHSLAKQVINNNMFSIAIENNSIGMLNLLLKYNQDLLKYNSRLSLVNFAVKKGRLIILKNLHNNGFPWNEDTCSCAARNGHLECLKYLHKNDCPWNKWTCLFAAEEGNLECLKYAHENGCLWDKHTYICAAERGHLECLEYVYENGCPQH